MQDEQKNPLETRLDAAAWSGRPVSPLPDAVVATVRRYGRVRRAKLAALGLTPIALAAGLVLVQLNNPADSNPIVLEPQVIVEIPFLDNRRPSLIGWREYALIFADSPRPSVARTPSERVYRVGDAYDSALIEALFSGS